MCKIYVTFEALHFCTYTLAAAVLPLLEVPVKSSFRMVVRPAILQVQNSYL